MSHLFKYISKSVLIVNHIILQGSSSEELQPQVSAYSHTGNPLSKACYFVTFSCLQPLFSICLVNIGNFYPLKPGNETFFSCRSCCTGRNASFLTLSPTMGRLFLSTQNVIVAIATWLLLSSFSQKGKQIPYKHQLDNWHSLTTIPKINF